MDLDINEQARITGKYPKGCARPADELQHGQWAEAQYLHGLRAMPCGVCSQPRFPQELDTNGACTDRRICNGAER